MRPADLLQQYRYGWQKKDLRLGAAPITAEFKL